MSQPPTSTDRVPDTPGMTPAEIEARMQVRGLQRSELTAQQEKLMVLIANGSTIASAARAVGYRDLQHVYQMLKRPDMAEFLAFYKEQAAEDVVFTRNNAHHMLMDAWVASGNAMEMVKVVDSLTKLHGLNEPDPSQQTNVQINIHNAGKVLEQMSDEDLLKLAGKDVKHLDPE